MLHRSLTIAAIILLGAFCTALAQTPDTDPPYCLRFVKMTGSPTEFVVKVQIKVKDGSTPNTFNVGNGNFTFTYNSAQMGTPVLVTKHNFDITFDTDYGLMTVTRPTIGRGSVNIVYNGTPGFQSGIPIYTTAWTDVCTIRFPPVGATFGSSVTANLVWREVTPNPTNLYDDQNKMHYKGSIYPAMSPDCFLDNDEPLPVELVSLTAQRHGTDAVRLAWRTATEMNNAGFGIERSFEHGPWVTIGYVDGHGTSNVSHTYEFIDDERIVTQSSRSIRYRLLQQDRDGTSEYSAIVEVRENNTPIAVGLTISPTPAVTEAIATVALPHSSTVTLRVYNSLGKVVLTGPEAVSALPGTHLYPLNVSQLKPGMYFVVAETTQGVVTKPLVIR